MALPAARPGLGLLRCPLCRLDLAGMDGALACANRHSFDLAREGYVNLTLGRRPRARGDDGAQLRHRAALLDAGHFDPVIAALVRRVSDGEGARAHWRVLDAGCGTGHHLAGTTAALPAPAVGLGLDVAADAARSAARRWPGLAFAVTDVWAAWPVRDQEVDLVISSFAPKNFAETARVLRGGGWLAVIHPGPDHLIELVRRFGLMRQRDDKAGRYRAAMEAAIGPATSLRVRHQTTLDPASIRDAILMGPNARHREPAALDLAGIPAAVTLDLAIVLARKPSAR